MRHLLICQRGAPASSERRLETLQCGELRWNDREGGGEAFIPAVAFKNAGSSYFGRGPFRLALPDLGGPYDQTTFYEAWRLAIQRYGIFNPFSAPALI